MKDTKVIQNFKLKGEFALKEDFPYAIYQAIIEKWMVSSNLNDLRITCPFNSGLKVFETIVCFFLTLMLNTFGTVLVKISVKREFWMSLTRESRFS